MASRPSRFDTAVQKSRGWVYLAAVAVGVVGKALGVVWISWEWIGAFPLVAGGSVLAFLQLARRGLERIGPLPVRWVWMALDVLIISWAVQVSGGIRSYWFVFYLANVAAASYVAGVRGMVTVMLANTVAYVGVAVWGEGGASWLLLAHAFGHKLLLYGAAVFALLGIPKLERRRREVRELQRQAQRRAEELAQLSSQLEAANQSLRLLSTHDSLTNLPNRRFLEESAARDAALVRRSLERMRRGRLPQDPNSSLGFLMVDLDFFKNVNDRYGHDAGDRVLVETARTLRKVMRDSDAVVRWGGEEFLVVARRVNRVFMWVIAERIREGVAQQRSKTRSGEEIGVTCSVGYCCYPLGGVDWFAWEEIVVLADGALLLAKRAGRNRCVGFEAGLRELQLGDRVRVLRNPAAAVRGGFLTLLGEVPPDLLEGDLFSSGAHTAVVAS